MKEKSFAYCFLAVISLFVVAIGAYDLLATKTIWLEKQIWIADLGFIIVGISSAIHAYKLLNSLK